MKSNVTGSGETAMGERGVPVPIQRIEGAIVLIR